MPADVHLDPAGLRRCAALAGELVDVLSSPRGPAAWAGAPDAPEASAECHRLRAAVDQAARELAQLRAALLAAAAEAEAADGYVQLRIRRAAVDEP